MDKPVHIGKLTITPVPVKHGTLDILGWEIAEQAPAEKHRQKNTVKSFLYLTDVSKIPPASMAQLSNRDSGMIRIVIIGGLRMRPHETHFNFEEALTAALAIGAKSIYLTHIAHSHSHREIEEFCRDFKEKFIISAKQTSVRELEKVNIHPAQDELELIL